MLSASSPQYKVSGSGSLALPTYNTCKGKRRDISRDFPELYLALHTFFIVLILMPGRPREKIYNVLLGSSPDLEVFFCVFYIYIFLLRDTCLDQCPYPTGDISDVW